MRWITRAIGVIAALVLLAVAALVAIPSERIAGIVTERVSAATGRSVTIGGDVRPTLFPSLGVRVGDVTVNNPDWVETGPLLSVDELHVSVEWAALWRGEIRLERAELIGPEIVLVRASDGRESWSFGTEGVSDAPPAPSETTSVEAPTSESPVSIGFDTAEIRDGAVRWIDEVSGQDLSVTNIDATASLPSEQGPATLEAGAEIEGEAFEVTTTVDGLLPLLSGQVRSADFVVSWPGGQAAFDGRLALTPALDGTFEIDATDFGPLARLAGAAAPELPQGLGRDTVMANGRLTVSSEGSLHLRDGTLTLDDNALALELDVLQGPDRPLVRGSVSGGNLSFVDLLETETQTVPAPAVASGTPENAAAAPSGWSGDQIDVSALFSADAELAVRLASVDLGSASLGAIETNVTLDRGRLVFDIGRVEAYGGRLAGQAVVNGRGGLSVGGDLILAGVQLGPLLEEFAGYDRLEGNGNASLQFLGVGNDMATIMRSLEGQGDLSFGAGAILGLDIAGMIRNLDASFRGDGAQTVYDSISANFLIDGGVLSNEDLTLEAPWGGVRGEGTVDLGAQTLDYRVTPGVTIDDQAAGIEVPVIIRGPWSSPSFRPDLEALAEREFLEQRDRFAAEAEARLAEEQERLEQDLRDWANGTLGTDIVASDTQDDIEDAIEERLTEEAENVLSRLLGGGSDGSDTE